MDIRHTFKVEQRSLPGTGSHTWVAIEEASGDTIPLPKGGDRRLLGYYPEIEAYLARKGITARLKWLKAVGDELELDHEAKLYSWSFNTAGGVLVLDIPRVASGVQIERSTPPAP